MRVRPRSFALAFVVAGIVMAGADAPPSVGETVPVPTPQEPRAGGGPDRTPPAADGPPRRFAGEDDRRDGRASGLRRRLSPEQIDAIVEVASEVFPDGGNRLRELRERDPATLERVLGRQARRFFGLAMLRQRNPELYALKLAELRNQMELRTLAAQHDELAEGDASSESARAEIETRIRAIAERQVDLGLRVRGLELAAMDEAIRRMRTELAEDAEHRDAAISEMVERVLAGDDPTLPEFRPDPGSRGRWGGRGGGGRPDRDDSGNPDLRPRSGSDGDAASAP